MFSFLYHSAYHIQMASLCSRGIITPALALMQPFSAKSIRRNKFLLGIHLLHLGRERQLWTKCLIYLGAYAPSGIRTHDLLITSREHEPLKYSAARCGEISFKKKDLGVSSYMTYMYLSDKQARPQQIMIKIAPFILIF